MRVSGARVGGCAVGFMGEEIRAVHGVVFRCFRMSGVEFALTSTRNGCKMILASMPGSGCADERDS
jgi:hypothetical protein